MLGTISGSGNIEINKTLPFIYSNTYHIPTMCLVLVTQKFLLTLHLSACFGLGAELSAGMEINKVLSTL